MLFKFYNFSYNKKLDNNYPELVNQLMITKSFPSQIIL